jgi:hypothetical protein
VVFVVAVWAEAIATLARSTEAATIENSDFFMKVSSS